MILIISHLESESILDYSDFDSNQKSKLFYQDSTPKYYTLNLKY